MGLCPQNGFVRCPKGLDLHPGERRVGVGASSLSDDEVVVGIECLLKHPGDRRPASADVASSLDGPQVLLPEPRIGAENNRDKESLERDRRL
jgi:hypothetical protein